MRRVLFLIIFLIIFLNNFLQRIAFCAQVQDSQNHTWVWNVSVVSPPGGWNSEPGKSISTALSWIEKEISESSRGTGGHDIKFVKLELQENLEPAIAAELLNLNIDSKTVAVMSFGGLEIDRVLVRRMTGNLIPLFLAGGENILIDRNGRPLSNIFALDLYRDYRCSAFAGYAKKNFHPETRLALAASRFTVNQEREAKICYELLDRAGFLPMPFWTDASVRDTFEMMSEEIESSQGEKSGVMISFLGSMGAREIWRNFMRLRSAWRLWNCSAPEDSYLSCRGMVLADQNVLLDKIGGFIAVKRQIWSTRAMPISDNVAAGRVLALASWLQKGIDSLPQPVDSIPKNTLLQNLERVKNIQFGNQILNISPSLHRPSERNVYIVEIKNRDYEMIDVIPTKGLVYVPSY